MKIKMKKIITVLVYLISTNFCAFAQTKNDKLYSAIIKGDTLIARQLLANRADPNYVKVSGPWMKVSMLITAVNADEIAMANLLIANKADINWKDGFQTTALMYAAAKGNQKLVALLLSKGADINDHDEQGNTVLSSAKESKNEELIKLVEARLKERK